MFEIELRDADLVLAAMSQQTSDELDILLRHPFVRALVDTNPNAILILNEQREIIFANQTLYDWAARWNGKTAPGCKLGEALRCVHAASDGPGCGLTLYCASCGILRAFTASLRGQEAVQESRMLQEIGDALDLRVWAKPLAVDSNIYTLLILADISHEKRRFALERVFFHDVLNTAGNILGISQLLSQMPDDSRAEMVEIMGELAAQLVEEIRAQQTLVSAEAGEIFVQTESVDSLKLLGEVVAHYAGHEAGHGRSLRIAPDAEQVRFDSDPALLRRVLDNMLKNALEACSPDETVDLNCYAGGGHVIFSVHNPGYMPRHVQLQLFNRSFSTKAPNRGLGTYSMKLLSERYLQGHVEFSSSPEAGTTFYARYPLRPMPRWLAT